MKATQIENLARQWAQRLDGDTSIDKKVEGAVVLMNFTKPADVQWAFILSAVQYAKTDNTLGHLAAGPLEHILGRHGDDYIDRVEAQAGQSEKFERMLTGSWRYLMNDDVWRRLQALQERAKAKSNILGRSDPSD